MSTQDNADCLEHFTFHIEKEEPKPQKSYMRECIELGQDMLSKGMYNHIVCRILPDDLFNHVFSSINNHKREVWLTDLSYNRKIGFRVGGMFGVRFIFQQETDCNEHRFSIHRVDPNDPTKLLI